MKVASLLRIAVSLAFSATSIISQAENSTAREYAKTGETESEKIKERDIYQCDPPPYVATSPFALALAPMFEAPGERWDVEPLRISLLVGRHRAVSGLDIGAIGSMADFKMDGIGVAGLFNSVGESDGAIHVAGLVNFAAFDYSGCQISGLYSCTEGAHSGAQIGLANYAGCMTGVQIGVFNYAENLAGVQIGAFNFCANSAVRFMPVLNLSF